MILIHLPFSELPFPISLPVKVVFKNLLISVRDILSMAFSFNVDSPVNDLHDLFITKLKAEKLHIAREATPIFNLFL